MRAHILASIDPLITCGAPGGGGGALTYPFYESRIGDRGGRMQPTVGAMSLLDDGTPFTVDIEAVAGDVLLIQAMVTHQTATPPSNLRATFSVAGVNVLGTDGVNTQQSDGGYHGLLLNYAYTVQSGDISAGLVTVGLVAGCFTTLEQAYIENDSDWATPTLVVTNYGQ